MRLPATPLLGLVVVLAGCLAPAAPAGDQPAVLPTLAYYEAEHEAGVGYHTYEEFQARFDAIAAARPDLVRVEVLGESREGRPIRALVLEDRAVPGPKPAPFFDGAHHGNEIEGAEILLFLADYLVLNHDRNATVRALVSGLETWIVPIVNQDGYAAQTRFNAAGVNLNRNYDLDWCDPAAYNTCPPGPVHEAVIPIAGPTPENAGTGPFSEPESAAIRDAVLALGDRVAFYLTHHTPAHCLAQPWTAPRPPFPVPPEDQEVFDAVHAWVRGNTEYGSGRWNWVQGDCMSYSAGGASQDWAYATTHKPSFTMEVAGSEAWEGVGPASLASPPPLVYDLPHWMRATLPIELFFLTNAARLQAWEPALADPWLPEGAPPEA